MGKHICKVTLKYNPFSGKLFYNACGSKFVRHSCGTGKHKHLVWIFINHQMNGDEACNQKAVKERALEKDSNVLKDLVCHFMT